MKHNIIATKDYLLVVNESEIGGENDYFYLGKKIIAHLPLNNSPILEGVDLLPPIEDDVEKLAKQELPISEFGESVENKREWNGFKKGYNKAKEKYKYTEEDLYRMFLSGNNLTYKIDPNNEESFKDSFSVFKKSVQSLQQPKMPVEFECEINNPMFALSLQPQTTINSQGLTQWVGKYIYNK
jgi:hypothetical protein